MGAKELVTRRAPLRPPRPGIAHRAYLSVQLEDPPLPVEEVEDVVRSLHGIRHQWAQMDLNHRPHPYQGCALTELSYGPLLFYESSRRFVSCSGSSNSRDDSFLALAPRIVETIRFSLRL